MSANLIHITLVAVNDQLIFVRGVFRLGDTGALAPVDFDQNTKNHYKKLTAFFPVIGFWHP